MNLKLLALAALALGTCVAHDSAAAQGRQRTLRPDCIGDRCVYRDRHGNRVVTVQQLPPGRVRVTDRLGRTVAKVRERDDGTVSVEEPSRW